MKAHITAHALIRQTRSVTESMYTFYDSERKKFLRMLFMSRAVVGDFVLSSNEECSNDIYEPPIGRIN